jgi:hypothetical protein
MYYPKTNNLWKRKGLHINYEDKLAILEKYGKFPFEIGIHADPTFKLVEEWDVEEKIDGTNICIELKERRGCHSIKIYGKTKDTEIPAHLLEYLKKEFTPQRLIHSLRNTGIKERGTREVPAKIIFCGEGCGERIQGDYYNLKIPSFILFDIYTNNLWTSRDTVRTVAKQLGIKSAPFMGKMTEQQMIDFVKSNPQSEINPDVKIEGIIARGEAWEEQADGSRQFRGYKKFKLKCRDF